MYDITYLGTRVLFGCHLYDVCCVYNNPHHAFYICNWILVLIFFRLTINTNKSIFYARL